MDKTQIIFIARLGEKIFDEVNRATTVIVCKKAIPVLKTETVCFRLSTDARKRYLAGNGTLLSYFDGGCHSVKQSRFANNAGYNFDIDTHTEEESLLKKLTSVTIDWEHVFTFGRGVEISKAGKVLVLPARQGLRDRHNEMR